MELGLAPARRKGPGRSRFCFTATVAPGEIYRFRDEYVANRNLVAWNFYNPLNPAEQVDIVITYDLTGKRRHRVVTADGPVHTLSREDLISMKRASGRPQDLEDAGALERLP